MSKRPLAEHSVEAVPPSEPHDGPKRRRPKHHGGGGAPAPVAATAAPDVLKWGSKQPKPADAEVASYLLTAGGELARRAQARREGDAEDDEARALREHMLKEITNGEASLACHERASRVLQGLIKHCEPQELFPLFSRLKPYIGHLLYDKYASHVLQDLLAVVAGFASDAALVDLVDQLGGEVNKADEWWALMHDAAGSHSARALVACLHKLERVEQLDALAKTLLKAPLSDLRGACKDVHAGPFVSVALGALPSAHCEAILAKLLSLDQQQPAAFESVVADTVASHLLDTSLAACTPAFRQRLFDARFRGHLQELALHPVANYAVQRVLEHVEFDAAALDELEPVFMDLVAGSHLGVLVAVVNASRTPSVCARVVRAIFVVSNGFVAALLSMRPSADDDVAGKQGKREVAVSIPGAELVGAMLAPHVPEASRASVVEALARLPRKALEHLCCDPFGGRQTVEVALQTGSQAMVRQMCGALERSYATLAVDKFASHVVRKAFDAASPTGKRILVRELVDARDKVVHSKYGLALAKHCGLDAFKRDPAAWEAALSGKAKTRGAMEQWLAEDMA